MYTLRNKLDNGEAIFGTHISLYDPVITEIIGRTGYDYLWIDTEHTSIDLHCLELHLMAARAAGVASVVRVPWYDAVRAKPVLEMGPDGIIFPMIRSYENALEAMQACLYPPHGIRGFGPRNAMRFGETPLHDYLQWVNHTMLKMIQIEHIDAVRDIDRILTIDEIDAYVFGPCDLSSSVGKLSQWDDDEVKALFRTAAEKIRKANKILGVSFGSIPVEEMQKWRRLGVRMISIGMDTDYLRKGATDILADLKHSYQIS